MRNETCNGRKRADLHTAPNTRSHTHTSLNTRTRLSDPTPSVVLPRQSRKVVILDTSSSGKALRHKISHFFDFLPPAAGGTSTTRIASSKTFFSLVTVRVGVRVSESER